MAVGLTILAPTKNSLSFTMEKLSREEMLIEWKKKRDASLQEEKAALRPFTVPTHVETRKPMPTKCRHEKITRAWQLDACDSITEAAEKMADFWVEKARVAEEKGSLSLILLAYEQALKKKAEPVSTIQNNLRAVMLRIESGKLDTRHASSFAVFRQRVDTLLRKMDRLRGVGAGSLTVAPTGSPLRAPPQRVLHEDENHPVSSPFAAPPQRILVTDDASPPPPPPSTPLTAPRRVPLQGPQPVAKTPRPSYFTPQRASGKLGTFTTLTPVRANKRDRDELGIESAHVLTPVRRCFRNNDEDYDENMTPPAERLLNDTEYSFRPNDALVQE